MTGALVDETGDRPLTRRRRTDDRKLEKTEIPGIYQRGSRYVVTYRDPAGRPRKRFAPTLAAAKELRTRLLAGVWRERAAVTELRRQAERERRARSVTTIADSYADLRRAAQSVDRAAMGSGRNTRRHLRKALTSLHEAEDYLVRALYEEREVN